jgi:nitrogen fixation protein
MYSEVLAAGGSPMFSDEDAQFLREVIGTDAHIHYTHLQKLAKRKFPKEPVENFIICIDYTNTKYPAGTCSLKNIKTYVFPPVSSDATNPANVEAQNAEMIKM